MFTGIITDIGTITKAEQRGDLRLVIQCNYDMAGVDLGASIACSGCCLTVVDKGSNWFAVDASAETVVKTVQGLWAEGGKLNLERALKVGDERNSRARLACSLYCRKRLDHRRWCIADG
jgi:riboflavin synthase